MDTWRKSQCTCSKCFFQYHLKQIEQFFNKSFFITLLMFFSSVCYFRDHYISEDPTCRIWKVCILPLITSNAEIGGITKDKIRFEIFCGAYCCSKFKVRAGCPLDSFKEHFKEFKFLCGLLETHSSCGYGESAEAIVEFIWASFLS